MLLLSLLCITITNLCAIASKHIQFTTLQADAFTQQISISFDLPKKDFIYQEFITFSTDNPAVTLSEWSADTPPVNYYDPIFKNTKQIFNKSLTITINARAEKAIDENVNLFCSYYQQSEKKIKQCVFPLLFAQQAVPTLVPTNIDTNNSPIAIKTRMVHNNALDDYLIAATPVIAYFMQPVTITGQMHLLFILVLICLAAFFWFFYRKAAIHSTLAETTKIMGLTCGFILLGYAVHYAYSTYSSHLLLPIPALYALSIGVFYIKQSTTTHLQPLRMLCSFFGCILIISAIFLAFKAIQTLYA